jgi:hypothetical protein
MDSLKRFLAYPAVQSTFTEWVNRECLWANIGVSIQQKGIAQLSDPTRDI